MLYSTSQIKHGMALSKYINTCDIILHNLVRIHLCTRHNHWYRYVRSVSSARPEMHSLLRSDQEAHLYSEILEAVVWREVNWLLSTASNTWLLSIHRHHRNSICPLQACYMDMPDIDYLNWCSPVICQDVPASSNRFVRLPKQTPL